MKLVIDDKEKSLTVLRDNESVVLDLYSDDAFKELSKQWMKIGWNQKYEYTFSWMGRPIIQLPEDMIRMQEIIYRVDPDVIIETGVAHGGSLIYYASLFRAMGKTGRVIGIDIEIRPHNRKAIEEHDLYKYIKLVEGDSTAPEVVQVAIKEIKPEEKVLVILDSCHSREHVLKELRAYAPFVTKNSYIVATDGIMQDLSDVPRGNEQWETDNPISAVQDFLNEADDFILETPRPFFNESQLEEVFITHWPKAWLRRIK